jgi:hypothetical protein
MAGFGDYQAEKALNELTGAQGSGSRYAALFTAAPSDAGTGGTEVSGGSYARVQVAGEIAAGASWTTSNSTITMGSSNPGWVVAGMNVYDVTASAQIGTVQSYSGTTLTLTTNAAAGSSGSTDSLAFCAWPLAVASSGAEPGTTPVSTNNGAVVTYPQATASWGTALYFGLYDALTGGNYLAGSWLGQWDWLPCSITLASPGVFSTHAHGYSNGDPLVVTAKYGGTVPTFSQSNLTGVLAAANVTTDTFTVTNASTPVDTSSSGDLMVKKILEQSIPSGITASFAADTMPLYLA